MLLQSPLTSALCIMAFIAICNVAILKLLYPPLLDRLPHFPLRPDDHTYLEDDFPSRLPIILPTTHLVLSSGAPRFSLTADDDWASLFPLSDGFTDLGPENRTFLVSMVHQLHCLDIFRVGFVSTNRTGYAHHVEHCLRYMLQIVLCNADTTLERDEPGMRNGRWVHAAGGIGSVHECRDWSVLRTYLDEHPAGPVRL